MRSHKRIPDSCKDQPIIKFIILNMDSSPIISVASKRELREILATLLTNHRIAVIQDENLRTLHDLDIPKHSPHQKIYFLCVPAKESAKTLKSVQQITDFLFEQQFDRQDLILAFGGGVLTDLVGFVASIYMRGIKFMFIPTTLLAMADASIGGKTGVNTDYGKNQLGVINDAAKVFICPQFLATLDKRNFLNGMAEIIKIFACFDAESFALLEQNTYESLLAHPSLLTSIIHKSVELKLKICQQDKYEQNIRKVLNYGHTIGHAIEFASQGELLHGECVSIGMVLANEISLIMGIGSINAQNRVINILKQYHLPTKIPKHTRVSDVVSYIKHDKKCSGGNINFIFIHDIGKSLEKTTPVQLDTIKNVLSNKCVVITRHPKYGPPIHSSKSITNRALLLAALSQGTTLLHNYTESEDTLAMINCLKCLKLCKIHNIERHVLQIESSGFQRLQRDDGLRTEINVQDSGTTARFLFPICLLIGNVTMSASTRMNERPMIDLIDALQAKVQYLKAEGHFPLFIHKQEFENGSHIKIKSKTSSQYVSAVLMMAPLLPSKTVTIEIIDNPENQSLVSESFIDMTIKLMRNFSVSVERVSKNLYSIQKQEYCSPKDYFIEPDATALTNDVLWLALNGGDLQLPAISDIQGDTKFLEVVQAMGMSLITQTNHVRLVKDKELVPIEVDCKCFSDTFISLALIMANVEGQSKITGIENQRVKECDRLRAVRENLNKIGVVCLETQNSLIIHGKKFTKFRGYPQDVEVHTHNDHRIAMAFSILGGYFAKIGSKYRLVIDNKHCVRKTFPDFFEHINLFGLYEKYPETTTEEQFLQKYQYYKEPIFIIGMRGAGKTTLSKYACSQLGLKYISVDELISDNINLFVETYGWVQFRLKEKQVLQDLIKQDLHNAVIDCGGGIVEDPQNVQLLQSKVCVYIEKSIEQITNDLQLSHRPDIGNVAEIFENRQPLYELLAKYIFSIPSKREYFKTAEIFKDFLAAILRLKYPKNRIYAKNTSFVCFFYEDIYRLTEDDIQKINVQHNALEVRIDKISSSIAVGQIRQELMNLRLYLKIPLIITLRTVSQGGFYQGSEFEYAKLINKLRLTFLNDFFDVEYDKFHHFLSASEFQFVLSSHLYQAQSSIQIATHVEKLKQSASSKSDSILFIKLAIHQKAYAPQMVLSEIPQLFREMEPIIPVLVLPMGENTGLYRCLNSFMLPLSYFEPTAPGQMDFKQLQAIRKLTNFDLKQNYHIFGRDLSLSRSPEFHERHFNELCFAHDKSFSKVSILTIDDAEAYISDPHFQGASVTMPFKEEVRICQYKIFKFVHEKSIEVDLIGNVINTIVNYEGRILGFNTDWWGMFWPIYMKISQNELALPKSCLIIGNGGTAKTALFVARKLLLAECTVYGRCQERVEEFAKKGGARVLGSMDEKFDLVISTIPPKSELALNREWFMGLVLVAHQGADDFEGCRWIIRGREMFEGQGIGQVYLYNGK